MKTRLILFVLLVAPSVQAGTELKLRSVPAFLERVFVPVIPQERNTFEITNLSFDEVLESPKGYRIERTKNGSLAIHAPAGEGFGYARVRAGKRELTLTLMNLVPYASVRNGILDGYKIGDYLAKPFRGLSTYKQPEGFIRLTKANGAAWISDHYRLRDFQCKLDGKNKFLIVRPEALLKLELLQAELQQKHKLKFERFTIMSGYRTPFYNRMIGNVTSYSRHLYGDAMDIYVDRDGNGSMDDINRDGRIDTNDAKFLLRVAESIDNSKQWGWLKGGAGVYRANSAHGPYVHVDVRGYVARWGI